MNETPTKDEERAAKEKDAVASMRLAQSNMSSALNRIKRLEQAVERGANAIRGLKKYAPERAYQYNSTKPVADEFDDAEKELRDVL